MRRLRKCLGAALTVFIGVSGGGLPGLFSTQAEASVVNITFEYKGPRPGYRPDAFVYTTPSAQFCSGLATCNQYNEHKYTVNLPVSFRTRGINYASNWRDRYFFKLPDVTSLNLVNERGDSFSAAFKATHIGLRGMATRPQLVWNQYHGGCWGLAWRGLGTLNTELFAQIQDPARGCYILDRDATQGVVNDVRTDVMGITFTLQLPSAATLKNGVYRAQLPWSVGGAGSDFDLGDQVVSATPDRLILDFEITVKHPLKLEFPPGSERAVLEPPGGWASWINRGTPPQRLYRVLPFQIWTTGAISVHTRCEYDLGGRCGIRGRDGHQVPLKVALTLPSGMKHQGAPVDNLVVPVGAPAALRIDTVEATLDRQARLLFEVSQADTASMLGYPGETFQGDVTLVLDAAL
ncbi:hypothetical protein [Pseudomonas sp. 2(2015)]|uniref:hypothetical protein n=1 Tax=Pseudomonas sp. 2(2015) TaxID=1619950 RepID=UPI000695D801|nr:hypothetical protein [Pseudomonas sp. 2(2015)]